MELDERFADRVADLCFKKYQSLPKKGKPQKNKEWTLLSCVCLTRKDFFCIDFFHLKMQMLHYILFIIAIKLCPICMILSHLARKELYTVAWCNVSCYTIYSFTRTIVPFWQSTVHNTNVYGLSMYLWEFLLSYYVINLRGTNRNVWQL